MSIGIKCDQIKGPVAADDGETLLHEDRIDLGSALSRQRFGKAVAEKTKRPDDAALVERMLLDRLAELREQEKNQPEKPDSDSLLRDMPEDFKDEALNRLNDPDLIDRIKSDLRAVGLAGEETPGLGVYLIGTSRLLEKPIHGTMRGATSSGKSYVIKAAAKLFPPECKIEAHHLSPKALFHMADDALVHRFVVAGERARQQDDEQADATKALREMISDGVLRGCITQSIEGKLSAVPYEKRGPIAFIESTSAATMFAEDENRRLTFQVDETERQTHRIIMAEADAAANGCFDADQIIIQIHHALQRTLKPVKVMIPYARLIAERLPKMRVEARRLFGLLLNTIRAVALLHQRQRAESGGAILANDQDYEIALAVVGPSISRLCGRLDGMLERVLEAVRQHPDVEEFTRAMAATWAGVRESDAGPRLKLLSELGYIIETQPHRGNQPAKFKLNPDAPTDTQTAPKMPTVDEIRDYLAESQADRDLER